jgi:hypothetical protein
LREDAFIARLLLAFIVFQLLAAGWDLPSAFSWENDGIAPRDFFGGLAFNLTPGSGHRYPLFHYLLLALFCWPLIAFAALRAEDLSLPALEAEMLQTDVMTGISVIAKLIAIALACAAVLSLSRSARRLVSRDAGRFTALFAVTCLSFTYYGRSSNLDVPYLAWTALALDRLLSVREHGRLSDYVWLAVLSAASIATKDQAYASYVLPFLVYLVALPVVQPSSFAAGRAHWKQLGKAALAGVLALGALGGGLWNPSGFVARLAMLAGTNSQDWRAYSRDASGVLANLTDIARNHSEYFWPWPLVACALLGVALALRPDPLRVWRLLPLAAGLSSLVFFALVVARSSHRFVLPHGFFLAFYGGIACDALLTGLSSRALRTALIAVLTLSFGHAAGRCMLLAITQWSDARRSVEAALLRLPQGSVVEAYGPLVYQPRFATGKSSPYRLRYVGARDPKLLGAEPLGAPIEAALERRPDAIVITESYAARFLPAALEDGRTRSNQERDAQQNTAESAFVRAAVADALPGYRVASVATPALPAWLRALGAEPIRLHGATGSHVWVLRKSGPARDAALPRR